MSKIALSPVPPGGRPLPGLPEWLSRLLYARGVRTPEEAQAFLYPAFSQLLPPETLPGAAQAVRLLHAAREMGLKTVVYGDYDVDGVCASALMLDALRQFGLSADSYIPDRHEEGYGLNSAAVRRLSADYGLMITVDCGIASLREVEEAKALGMAVIVTDHHQIGEAPPCADAVVSPLIGDYPFPHLCGTGVAWKIALALLGDPAVSYLDLAALATVADLVPLTGENRVIVALGLPQILASARPGLKMLMKKAGLQNTLSAEQVAFQLAPRLNACGRIASAHIALELLTTRDAARAEALATQADSLNERRREEEAAVIRAAEEQVQKMDLIDLHAIVVCGEGWNSGVVGLAAGRIAEQYAYPTVALAEKDGVCTGSARSAGQVDLFQALSRCGDLFLRFGGHRQAAGLTLEKKNLPAFCRRFSDAVLNQLGGKAQVPQLACDAEMALADVTAENIRWLQKMEPFGMGNPSPRFYCRGAECLSLRPVGAEGRHLKCLFRQGGALRDGIFFGAGEKAESGLGVFDLAFTPVLNVFRGKESAEIRLQAMEWVPDAAGKDAEREFICLAGETPGSVRGRPIEEAQLRHMMRQPQGTLLYCRCLETALRMKALFPDADFRLASARDARAFNTVLLYGRRDRVGAPFRRVVFCDGMEESAFENAEVFYLPQTEAMNRLLSGAFLGIDELRDCYRALKHSSPQSLEAYAASCGVSPAQAAFALKVFSEIGLARFTLSPFQAALAPMQARSPEESDLYQRALATRR